MVRRLKGAVECVNRLRIARISDNRVGMKAAYLEIIVSDVRIRPVLNIVRFGVRHARGAWPRPRSEALPPEPRAGPVRLGAPARPNLESPARLSARLAGCLLRFEASWLTPSHGRAPSNLRSARFTRLPTRSADRLTTSSNASSSEGFGSHGSPLLNVMAEPLARSA